VCDGCASSLKLRAAFLSRKNIWLGLVLGGYVFDAASGDEGRRLMANVPLPKRVPALLLARRASCHRHICQLSNEDLYLIDILPAL
jgi:hypothetical protein